MFLVSIALMSTALSIIASMTAEQLSTPIRIVGSFVMLHLSYNSGIAFGIRLPVILQEILIGVALILICFVARTARTQISRLGFGLIIGGACANLFDRFGDGLVTDYISIGTFPIFNVADSCITIGVGLLFLEAYLTRKAHS
jgi:signal peptidase II